MTNEELEKKVKQLEKELRSFKSGSNNVDILLTLNRAVGELKTQGDATAKKLDKLTLEFQRLIQIVKPLARPNAGQGSPSPARNKQ